MNTPLRSSGASASSPSLPARASDDLRFVRDTLSRAARFTVVPSWSGVVMGAIGGLAALAARQASSKPAWLAIWLLAAALAALIGAAQSSTRAQLARFVLALVPSFVVASLLTLALVRAGSYDWLAPLWLLSYGAGVVAAGNVSIPQVTWMGVGFFALGAASLVTPLAWSDAWLGLGFGGLHVAFGLVIARSNRG
jgi:hypothetical protein